MKAFLKNYRQSPRKVMLVAGLVRGKSVPAARAALTFIPHKAAPDVLKLLNSAVANARQQGFDANELKIQTITVNKGMAMRRFMPKSRGRATRIMKTSSHIALSLGHVAGAHAAHAHHEHAHTEESVTETKPKKVVKAPVAKKTATKKTAAKKVTKKASKATN